MAMEEVKPLVVRGRDGRIIDVSLMNEKSYTKSRERGQLWHLNRDTGRVLPHNAEGSLSSLKAQHSWYEAQVDSPSGGSIAGPQNPGEAGESRQPDRPADETKARTADTEVLLRLEQLIRRRKADLPEGSYTTHLFTSGEEKIRKKTGEEAVELILARTPGETASEAADFIYHLLVLLVQLEIPLERVLTELQRREEGSSS